MVCFFQIAVSLFLKETFKTVCVVVAKWYALFIDKVSSQQKATVYMCCVSTIRTIQT